MPTQELIESYRRTRERHEAPRSEIVALLERMAIETVGEALPGAHVIEAYGEYSEDWVPTLRVRKVLNAFRQVLYDVEGRHSDSVLDDAIDAVNVEYLDVLIDITGDDYLGPRTIG